jgi:hypothetical protein
VSAVRALVLERVAGRFAVCRLGVGAALPSWARESTAFASVTWSDRETSVVCRESVVPQAVRAERGFVAFRVAGMLEFSAVGVLASLVTPLAAAGVSVVAIGTFDTDYLLVRADDEAPALVALRAAGHTLA